MSCFFPSRPVLTYCASKKPLKPSSGSASSNRPGSISNSGPATSGVGATKSNAHGPSQSRKLSWMLAPPRAPSAVVGSASGLAKASTVARWSRQRVVKLGLSGWMDQSGVRTW